MEADASNAIELGQQRGVIVVTCNDIPGHRIDNVLGPVYGITVRSRNIGASLGGGFRAIGGGEVKTFSRLFYGARNTAIERMMDDCKMKGGNAIVAFRFESNSFGESMAQVCAYGTACVVTRL